MRGDIELMGVPPTRENPAHVESISPQHTLCIFSCPSLRQPNFRMNVFWVRRRCSMFVKKCHDLQARN